MSDAGNDMVVRLEQELNALFPIVVRLGGMLMLVRLEHSRNARSCIVVTDGGNDIDIRLVQLQNANSPIVWMLFGMVIVCSSSQPLNALVPMAEMSEETVATSTSLYGGPSQSNSSPV